MSIMTKPIALAAQQRAFAAAIMTADTDPPDDLNHLFWPTPQGGEPRINVYRHAYRARLRDALRENHPVLHRVLGDQAFDDLANAFITARPSQHPSIRWFGNTLADFMQQHPEWLTHPSLADIARMEWALCTAFDAADADTLNVATLAAIPPEDWPSLCFTPHPSLRVLSLHWNVGPIWLALSTESEDTEGAENLTATEQPEALDHTLLVWRHNEHTRWRSASAEETAILQRCIAGETFANWCEAAAETQGENAAAVVAGYLRVWVEDGLLAGLAEYNGGPCCDSAGKRMDKRPTSSMPE